MNLYIYGFGTREILFWDIKWLDIDNMSSSIFQIVIFYTIMTEISFKYHMTFDSLDNFNLYYFVSKLEIWVWKG